MAASPATGERPTGFRRSSSQFAAIPQRSLSLHERVGLSKDDAAADVLYTHPSVRIYTFQPPTDALKTLDKSKKTLPDADYPIDAIEILPWRARTETLSARGKLIIEKVQGSVHFLKAGDLIYTIMKNSQCWCVDGESKFVMRIGRLRYQRIELPVSEPEDKKKVEEFKEVIGKILKFEKTPCPFIRAFQVDLPDDAITPRRRGTWKRKESLTSVPADEDPRPIRRTKTARTMSMRAMPPTAFPSRSLTQLEMERPRTASTPTSTERFSFPDVRTESPTNYASGEDNTDSDRHDSESDRPDTGHSSEFEESDRESTNVPLHKSPLNHVQTLSPVLDQGAFESQSLPRSSAALREKHGFPTVAESIASLNSFSMNPPSTMPARLEPAEPSFRRTDPSPRTTSSVLLPESPKSSNDVDVATMKEETEPRNQDIVEVAFTEDLHPPKQSQRTLDPLPIATETSVSLQQDTEDDVIEAEAKSNETVNEAKTDVFQNEIGQKDETDTVAESSPIAAKLDTQEDSIPDAEEARPSPPLSSLEQTKTNDDTESITSADSFHTLLSDEDPTSTQSISLGTRPFQHRREISDVTVTAASMNDEDVRPSQIDQALEPTSVIEQPDTMETDADADQDQQWPVMRTPGAFTDDDSELRQRLKHRRSLSPLPPATTLQRMNLSERSSPIPAEILQKAAALAVVKPIEVIVFMMQVLARIAGGATMNDLVSGDLFRSRPGIRRTASGTFEQDLRGRSSTRDVGRRTSGTGTGSPTRGNDNSNANTNGNESMLTSDEEDDFGVPVHGRRKSSNKSGETQGTGSRSGFTLGNDRDYDIDDAASHASID